jgi:integrase
MANIQERKTKDGQTHYRALIRLKGYPTQTATFHRKTDARLWVQQTEAAIREGRHFKTTEAKKHTLAELITRYITAVLPLKPKSQKKQAGQLTWWKNQLGSYSLADITPALIAEHRDKLLNENTARKDKRSPATTNRYLAALSHAFTMAVKEYGWIESNPLLKISKPKEPRGRTRFLSDEERTRLLDICRENENPYLYLVIVLLLSTGARKMEILGLKWTDIDFIRGIITLHQTKNGEKRLLPLTGYALELMHKHGKVRRINCPWIFPSHDGKKPMDLRKPFETALKKAEINDFRWHDLRHSAASYLAMNGASMSEIAEVLGHKTLQMVKRYAHLSEAHTASVVSRMNEKIFGIAR